MIHDANMTIMVVIQIYFRGHLHIESSHSLRQIDTSGWVGLAL